LSRTQFFFPNDIISYGSGLIKEIDWKKYLTITFLGYIPHFLLLASVGKELQTGFFSVKMVFYTVLILFMAIIYSFRSVIYKFIQKQAIKKNIRKK